MKIEKQTLDFLNQLGKNNNREWFQEHKQDYEKAKENVLEFTGALMSKLYPNLENYEPKKSIFRINRDVRFSKDKTPYKVHFGVVLHPEYKKTTKPALYFQVNKDGGLMGAGQWMPTKEELINIRQEIDYSGSEFGDILKKINKTYELDESAKLKRPPKGYDADNPNVEYLKLKSFVVFQKMNKKEMLAEDLISSMVKGKKKLDPFLDFLSRAQF